MTHWHRGDLAIMMDLGPRPSPECPAALVIQVLGHLEPATSTSAESAVNCRAGWFKWGWKRGECLLGKADDLGQLPP